MISMLRNAASGWTAKILLILLAASFVFYGASTSMLSGPGASVVSVGGTQVGILDYRLAYANRVNAVSRQIGTQVTDQQALSFGIPQLVLGQLTSGAVLDENARQMGLGISNDKLAGMIGDDPSFNDMTGNFSRSQLRAVLRQVGMSEERYVENRKSVAVRSQLIQGVTQNSNLPKAFYSILEKSRAEKRIFDYAIITKDDIAQIDAPNDTDMKEYYDSNVSKYQAPQFRKVTIVKLEAEDIVDESSVTSDEIEQEYEATKAKYTTEETREIQQLVFTDRTKAEAASKRISEGETFDTIVAELNKTPKDISLGKVTVTEIADKNIADAAFALKLNEVSDIVDGLFGAVILRAVEVNPESVKPISEVEAELKTAVALRAAADQIYDTHDKIEDERAAGETLSGAAKLADLTPQVIEMLDRTGRDDKGNPIADIPEQARLISELFNTDEGIETAPLALGSSGFIWYEVNKITETRTKSFDEVKDQIAKDWLESEEQKAVTALANTINEKISSGTILEAALKEALNKEDVTDRALKSVGLLRTDTSKDLNSSAIQVGYSVKKGSSSIANNEDGTGKIVIRVSEIIEGNAVPTPEDTQEQLNGALQEDVLSSFVGGLQENQSIDVNQTAIEAALNPNYGQHTGGHGY